MDLNKVQTVWTGVAGTPYYTSLYTVNAAVTPAAAASAAANLWTALKGLWRSPLQAQVGPTVEVIDSASGSPVGIASVSTTLAVGTSTGEALPPATSALVSLNTGGYLAGRQIRGRIFMPPFTESENSVGAVGASTVTQVNTAFQTYLTAMGPAAVVWSRKNGIGVAIASAACSSKWSSLRSHRD